MPVTAVAKMTACARNSKRLPHAISLPALRRCVTDNSKCATQNLRIASRLGLVNCIGWTAS